MIEITKKKNCCGCGACRNVCPKEAVTMVSDREGFSYPAVDKEKCVGCGLCSKVCPMGKGFSPSLGKTFVAFTRSGELRRCSSSGGIFSELAEKTLACGGVVFGAAFAEDFSVHHKAVEESGKLSSLRGSKYVQSDTGDSFRRAKAALESGQQVLYSGTACQIAGLREYLGKPYETLLTVDVLCHGVPSPLSWQAYKNKMEADWGAPLKKADFRSKDSGWQKFSMKLEFENGKIYSRPFPEDAYMQAFLRNINLRPACCSCKFRSMNRPSDITLGDCWDIANVDSTLNDNGGISVVIAHTEKGRSLLEALEDRLEIHPAQLDAALPPAAESRRPAVPHPGRRRFFAQLRADSFPSVPADTAADRYAILAVKIWRKLLRMVKA